MAVQNKVFLIFLFSCLHLSQVKAQEVVDSVYSIRFEGISLPEALIKLNELEGVKLSYNPDKILQDKKVEAVFVNESIENILEEILGPDFEIKVRGTYLIIQPKKEPVKKKHPVKLSGSVKDATTGQVIKDVTVYEVNELDATLTNDRGEFDLFVKSKSDYLTLAVSQVNYQDTIIQVRDISEMNVKLQPIKKDRTKLFDRFEIETKKLVQFFTTSESRKNARNVYMQEEQFFQFSVVPLIGTNGKLSGQIKNKFSVNLLAGYAYGVNGLEIGGFYNIDRRTVSGVQMAGFGNAVGGESHGVQLAGFLNTTKGYTNGVQGAGFVNIVSDDVKGVQGAGFVNVSKKIEGVQGAGYVNVAAETKGVQGAGFVNVAKDMEGFQGAGFVNVANDVKGVQAAGFVNFAQKLRGVQIGILNIADTVETGVPIGLLNIVRRGMIQFGVEHNEFMNYNVALRTGLYKFYSVISAGITPSDKNLWSYGFGFGTQYKIKSNWYGNVELSAHNIIESGRDQMDQDLNLLNRLNLNFGYQLAKRFSLNMGPVLNLYLSKIYDPVTDVYGDFNQNGFYESVTDDVFVSAWVGYAASLRF